MKFRDPSLDPPGGWYFMATHDGKQYRIDGDNLTSVISNIQKFCFSNGIEFPSYIEQLVIRQICKRCPTGWCEDDKIKLNAEDFISGGSALLHTLNSDNLCNDDAVIMARADNCRVCPFNVETRCGACEEAKRLFSKMVKHVEMLTDSTLHNCVFCHCFIAVKTQLAAEYIIKSHNPKHKYPLHVHHKGTGEPMRCWMSELLQKAKV